MNTEKKELKDSHEIELTLTLSPEDLRPYLEKSAKALSEKSPIKGFRPGHVGFDVMRKRFGDSALIEAAIDQIVSKTLYDAIKKEDIETVGQPRVDIKEAGDADKPMVYVATLALLPEVTLPKIESISVKQKKADVTDEDISEVLGNIQESRSQEALVDRPAKEADKVEVDFSILIDNVPLEGGQEKKYQFVVGKKQVLPEFEEKILGMKAGEEKEFEITFPKDYFKKDLQGNKGNATLTLKAVFEITKPDITDELVQTLSPETKTVEEFKELIKKNLGQEKATQEQQKAEQEMLETLVKKSTFSAISEAIVHSEAHGMVHEMKNSVSQRGVEWPDYLSHMNKSEKELEKEFLPQAEERVKTALVVRKIAAENKIEVEDAEVAEEIANLEQKYQGLGDDMKEKLNTKSHQDHMRNILQNRKTITFLSKAIIKPA